MGSAVARQLLRRGKNIAASRTLMPLLGCLLSNNRLGRTWLLRWLQMLVGRGKVGLQVGFHGWQVCELLPAVATLPPLVVIIEDILFLVFFLFRKMITDVLERSEQGLTCQS